MLFRILILTGILLAGASVHAQFDSIRINEILANNVSYPNPDGTVSDTVEFHNAGATPVDLAGCSLSDTNAAPLRYVFPVGSVIGANDFRVLKFDSSQPASTNNVPFGIKGSGGYLFFYAPGALLKDAIEYGLQIQDFSIGRVPDGSGLWALTTPTRAAANGAATLGARNALIMNEWMAQPSSGNDYFEVYNPGTDPVALGGMYLTDNNTPTKFRIADLSFIGTGPGGFLRFDADSATDKYPADHVSFGLSSSEIIRLIDTDGATEVSRGDPAPVSGVSRGRLPDGTTNIVAFPKINDYDTASPGEPNFLILTNLQINELLAHTDPPLEDAIEFLNNSQVTVDIGGWWLSNARVNRKRYQLPAGTSIAAGGFWVLYEGVGSTVGFNSSSAASAFTFNSARGDQAVLSQVDGNGNLTGYIVYEAFESSANGVSFGHYNTSVPGDYKFVAMSALSFGVNDPVTVQEFRTGAGLINPFPKVGPIVINEIMFAPTNTLYGTNLVLRQNPDEEFIELRNLTNGVIPLYDPAYPTNRWRLQNAVEFTFPLAVLQPNQFCLVVGFDPATNAAALANFRSRYSVSNNVPIFGPWIGRLSDTGNSVELYRPDPVQLPPRPDAGYVPQIRIDKVNYSVSAPWPGGAVGTGKSLQRKNSALFGNDPLNWAVDAPNAGLVSLALQDTDGDGMTDTWELANSLSPNSAADAILDPDGDGVNNLGEFYSGTNPHSAASVLRIGDVIPFVGTNVPAIVRFFAYSNATYSVEYRNSLLPTAMWQKLGDVNSAPLDRVVEVQDPNAYKKTDRYYRVVAPATN